MVLSHLLKVPKILNSEIIRYFRSVEQNNIETILVMYGAFYPISFSVLQLCEHLKSKKGLTLHIGLSVVVLLLSVLMSSRGLMSSEYILFSCSPLIFVSFHFITNKAFKSILNREFYIPKYMESGDRYDWLDWLFSVVIALTSVMTPWLLLDNL